MLHAIAHPALTPHPLRTPLAAILYSVPGLLLSVYFEFLLSFPWGFVTSEGGQDWGPNGWVTGYSPWGEFLLANQARCLKETWMRELECCLCLVQSYS